MMFLPLRAACCVCVGTLHSRPRLLVCIISWCCQSIRASLLSDVTDEFPMQVDSCPNIFPVMLSISCLTYLCLWDSFIWSPNFFCQCHSSHSSTWSHTEHGHKIALSIPVGRSPSAEWGDIYALLCRTEMECSPLEFTAVGGIWGIGGLVMSCSGWSRAE